MDNLIKDMRENLNSYSFKVVSDLVKELDVNRDNKAQIKELADLLKEDKRKNVSSLGNRLEKNLNNLIKEEERVKNMYLFDKSFGDYKYVAGVDEVGRGPLAGPIVSAAVILDSSNLDDIILYINDSKKLSEHKREELSEIIKEKALSYSISMCDSKEIDEKGIGYCNNHVFIKACEGLNIKPDLVLSDGYLIKNFNEENKHVIKGDTKSACIACASIIAKVYRDNIMKEYHKKYPQYDFEKNVGYGTKTHVDALKEVGPTEIHRMSFLKNIL
ncbi:ribonuclease HII [Clostridium perfringens]|uniref:ribonuclease HII n=1 Tax=Clostridium perfringens TaxID=1502 RepID=UPI000E19C34A|nr:ribonuclease HII [Clostridium perfringens]MDG6875895.1 Ribonuclease HII [Clostridium perfringens]MDG6882953.1 Ribonuclease HII [Clostridium perfringens]MDG6885670.1 Ribonuclease HII [Clostridium perfringens]MDH5076886.1 Ribonuclease HII [Clostridium perfringens]MDK0558091.1 ribonuclease HII [Clostridium perfringens]